MAKPTADTRWATAGTKVQPNSGQKDAGWAVGQKPPAQWLNWWMDAVDQWVQWLDDYENTAHSWSQLQKFDGGASAGGADGTHGLFDAQGSNNTPGVYGLAGTGATGTGVTGVGVNRPTFGNVGVKGLGGSGTNASSVGGQGGVFLGGAGGATAGDSGEGLVSQGGAVDGTTNTTGIGGTGGSFRGGAITADANSRKGGSGVKSEGGLGQDGYGPSFKGVHGDLEWEDGDLRQTSHGSSGVNQLLGTYIGEDLEVNGAGIFNAAMSIAGLLTASGGIALEAPIAIAPILNAPYTEHTTCTYWKNGFGEVGMRGILTKNAAAQGSTAFTLPAGYRPAVAQRYVVSSDPDLGFAYVYVSTTGAVQIQWDTAFSSGFIVLDSVHFRNS